MKDEYIRKQDAVDAFNRAVQDVGILDADDIETVFGMLSSADVAPVVHGHWIMGKYTDDDLRYNDYSYRCNRCGKIVDFEENYCPHCGVRMYKE